MAKARDPDKVSHEALCSLGERIARHYGIPVTHVRYVKMTLHNGKHWTIKAEWQTYRDNQWVDEQWPYPWG